MKQRVLSIITALALCIGLAAAPAAYAWQGEPAPRETFSASRSTDLIPTPQQVYEAMIALKEDDRYKEGTRWTNDTPYTLSNPYNWKGGALQPGNITGGVGCAAFAFLLSDAAFGELPGRMYAQGGFQFSDVKAGDILRVNGDSHNVIILQVTDAGVVVAEGNYNSSVHWGRTMTKEEVMAADYYITRYPENYVSPDDPTADDPVEGGSGTLAGGLAWKLTKAGTLTISGTGAMPDFTGSDQPWNAFNSQILKIVLENGVTSIGGYAFCRCSALSAEIPASVKTIGSSAFRECSNLISVSASEGVESIGGNAFRACAQLKTITLPASITSVGDASFFQCQALTEVVFKPSTADKTVTMGANIFTRCYYLTTVTLPQRIDQIGEGMFQNCLMLFSLVIPQGAESINNSAFASCSRLTAVEIPASVTSIGTAAFADCGYLTDIYYGGSEEQWNSVGKLGDVPSSLSNVTVHYNSSAPVTPPETPPDNPPETPPPSGHTHSWDSGEITKPAACTEDGTRTYTCTGCGETKEETIPATGHSFTGNDDDGYVCSGCGETVSPAVKVGYETVKAVAEKPNDTLRADQAYVSADSAKQYVDSLIGEAVADKGGFQYSINTIKYTEPTVTAEGEYIYTVTLQPATRAAGALDTERFYMVIPKIAAPSPSPNPPSSSGSNTGSNPGSSSTGSYSVSVSPVAGGKITTDPDNAAPGSLVAVRVTPDKGYVVKGITVAGSDGPVSVSGTDGSYTFTMPKGAVTITADIVSLFSQFTDVPAGVAEYSAAIEWAVGQGITVGTSPATFSPNAPCTRGQMVVFLYRAAGSPADVAGTNAFTDIPAGDAELQKAVQWAVSKNITQGTGAATFDPYAPCTRAQMVTFLHRNSDEAAAAGSNSFADVPADAYYKTAIQWAVNEGITKGYSDTAFGPGDACTRVQMVTFLYRDMAK